MLSVVLGNFFLAIDLIAEITLSSPYGVIYTLEQLFRVVDDFDEYRFALHIELDILDDDGISAIIHYPNLDKLQKLLEEKCKKFLRDEVAFNDIFNGFNNEQKRSTLKSRLQEIATQYGRSVQVCTLENLNKVDIPDKVILDIPISKTPYLSEESITIGNKIRLVIANPLLFKKSGIKDLTSWLHAQLDSTLTDELFEKRYKFFLTEFGSILPHIQETMREIVSGIGYDVQHLMSRAEMSEEKYLSPKPYSMKFESLPTRSANIQVSFTVTVTYHFEDLEKIQKYLDSDQPVESKIEEHIQDLLVTTLNEKDPEQIYMRFSYDPDSKKTLEKSLVDKITKLLKKEFKAKISGSVVVKPEQTDVGRFVTNLLDQNVPFEVEFEPLGGTQTFHYRGHLITSGISMQGWDRVSKMNFTLEQIIAFYKAALVSEMEAIPSDEILAYVSGKHRKGLEEQFANGAPVKEVEQKFGVRIEITNFARKRTEQERSENILLSAIDKDDRDAALAALEDKLFQRDHEKELRGIERQKQRSLYKKAQEVIVDNSFDGETDDLESEETKNRALEYTEKHRPQVDTHEISAKQDILEHRRKRHAAVESDSLQFLDKHKQQGRLIDGSEGEEDAN